MISPRIQKLRFTSILITILIALCSMENKLAAAEVTRSGRTTYTDINHPAVITGIDRASVTEDVDPDADSLLEVSRKLKITDSDVGEAAFIAKIVKGSYGRLRINPDGNWTYVANNNQAVIQNLVSGARLTDKLIIASVDGTSHTIVIKIKGINEPNNPAMITGIDRASVTEDVDPDADNLLEVSRKLKITDSDVGEAAFIAKIVKGSYGRLRINPDGNWSYVANNKQAVIQKLASGAKLTDSLVVNSVDGTPHTIVIKIKGIDEVNNPALITGFDRGRVTEDVDPDANNLLEVSRKLNITDSDAGEAAFIAKIVKGSYGRLRINPDGNWSYAANNKQAVIQKLASGAKLTDSLVINSVDGTTHTVKIIILGADEINTPADITLSWVAPAEREDNSALSLSAIAGYHIYYGSMQGQYPNSVTINDGSAVAYIFTGLPADTYYFVVTTIDTKGRESLYSPEVKITI